MVVVPEYTAVADIAVVAPWWLYLVACIAHLELANRGQLVLRQLGVFKRECGIKCFVGGLQVFSNDSLVEFGDDAGFDSFVSLGVLRARLVLVALFLRELQTLQVQLDLLHDVHRHSPRVALKGKHKRRFSQSEQC